MKTMKKLLFVCMMMCVLFAMPVNAAAKVSISKTKISVMVGNNYNLKMKGSYSSVKWTSCNPDIARVSSTGRVTAVRTGKAKIRAQVGSKYYYCTVNVVSISKKSADKAFRGYCRQESKFGFFGSLFCSTTKKADSRYSYYTVKYLSGTRYDYKIDRTCGRVYKSVAYKKYHGDMGKFTALKFAFNLCSYL